MTAFAVMHVIEDTNWTTSPRLFIADSLIAAALWTTYYSDRARQRPGSLSGGHQQLVAIARAIAGRPPIVLADEPTGNLDSKSGEAVMQMLEELHADGATIGIATHDPRHIARTTHRIYLLDGRVVPVPVA